jgi:AcrR family transcriptional regulator
MPRASAAGEGVDSRERILRAALEIFALNGFDGARTREIAAQAGVPLGLLQYHFGEKPKLWRAAVDRAFEELHAGLEAILVDPAPGDERERLRLLVRAHTQFVARNPEFVRLMHDEGKRRGPRMRWMVDRHVKPLFLAVLPMVEGAQQQGHLPADIPAVHFVYILAGAVGVIFHQAEECKRVSGIDPAAPAAVEAHARAVEYLFLGHARQESMS